MWDFLFDIDKILEMVKYFALSFLVLIGNLSLYAQGDTFNYPTSLTCADAPTVCPLDGFSSSTGTFNATDQPSTFCGSIQNNQWIAFIAGSDTLRFNFNVDYCPFGDGLQVQVYGVCGNPWTSVSNCIYEVLGNSTEEIYMYNLTIGEKYYLMVDGKSGDRCDYSIEVIEGFTWSSITSNVADAGEDVVINCMGDEVTLDGSNSFYGSNDSIYWVDKNNILLSEDITLSVSEPGKYYFIIKENGVDCILGDEVEVIEEVLPNPFLFTFVSFPLDSFGQFFFLEAIDSFLVNANYIYSWTTLSGNIVAHADSIFPLISSSGYYRIEITDPMSGCILIKVIVVNCLAPVNTFLPHRNILQVEITPTVTDDEIRVHYVMENTNPVSIQVYNIGGVLLQDFDFGKKATGEHVERLSLKDLTTGVYFVLIKAGEGSAVRKVVKM